MHTRSGQFIWKFPPLKIIAKDVREIWSIVVAYLRKLTKSNNLKILLAAIDVLSRYLQVIAMRTERAHEVAEPFEKMVERIVSRRILSDKETEFKGSFKTPFTKKPSTPTQQFLYLVKERSTHLESLNTNI